MKVRSFNKPIDFSESKKTEKYKYAHDLFSRVFFSTKYVNKKKNWSFWDQIHKKMLRSMEVEKNLVNFQSCTDIAPTICGNGGDHFIERLKKNVDPNIVDKYIPLYIENLVGNPPDMTTLNGVFITKTAMRHFYYAIFLKEKLELLGERKNSIVEVGGGFGNLCKISHDFNFAKQYIIIDLPEMLLVQYFYLSHFFEKSSIAVVNDKGDFVTGGQNSRVCLLPTTQVKKVQDIAKHNTIFVSTVALTEIDHQTQKEYLDEIPAQLIYIYGQKMTLGREGGKAVEETLDNYGLMVNLFDKFHCIFFKDYGYFFEYFGSAIPSYD